MSFDIQISITSYIIRMYLQVMIVGDFKGTKVQDAKKLIQKQMLDKGEAVIYHEPENTIITRSNDTCVVALCDQW